WRPPMTAKLLPFPSPRDRNRAYNKRVLSHAQKLNATSELALRKAELLGASLAAAYGLTPTGEPDSSGPIAACGLSCDESVHVGGGQHVCLYPEHWHVDDVDRFLAELRMGMRT